MSEQLNAPHLEAKRLFRFLNSMPNGQQLAREVRLYLQEHVDELPGQPPARARGPKLRLVGEVSEESSSLVFARAPSP